MKASRSPGERRLNNVRKLASEPPFVTVTLSAPASGYQLAMLVRVSKEPSDRGYPSLVNRNASASAVGPMSSRIVMGRTPDSERS